MEKHCKSCGRTLTLMDFYGAVTGRISANCKDCTKAKDWRELYRIQTAMRYMDNNPGLTRDHAFSWADQEVADAERAMLAAARKGE